MNNNSYWHEDSQDYKDSIMSQNVEKGLELQVIPDPWAHKQKKKSNVRTYIALVLTSSILSSAVMGGVMYSVFTSKMEQHTEAIKTEKAINYASEDKSATNDTGNNNISKLALAKGSAVTEIAKKVGPSIVGIRMTVANSYGRFFGDDLGESKAEGSGVIITADGYIMTNYHVVEYADPKNRASKNTTLEVFLPDKRQVKAKFIGGDSKNDLAVIKVDLTGLPAAELGDSSKLEVGEQAVAIGNPLGMEFAGSVTVGVVSALNRKVEADDKVLNLIQTDAAINPGNSGGALVNSQGQVIGINTIKISVAGVEGLGFAIPMNDAKPIVDQLIMFGYVKGRPVVGITGRDISEVLARQYSVPQGIYITEIGAGSGAEKAGLQKGDIIVSLAGKTVKTMKDLEAVKKNYKAGDTVDIVVNRDGTNKTFKLTFSEER
ncbi:MAG: trypsin-like peptidase domain-containing protein [Clostridia bacterium]|nr:trypsin-like peptidase domain-containing protein [Clostridia bacterium]